MAISLTLNNLSGITRPFRGRIQACTLRRPAGPGFPAPTKSFASHSMTATP